MGRAPAIAIADDCGALELWSKAMEQAPASINPMLGLCNGTCLQVTHHEQNVVGGKSFLAAAARWIGANLG
jgi:hypothetical protein